MQSSCDWFFRFSSKGFVNGWAKKLTNLLLLQNFTEFVQENVGVLFFKDQ